MQQAGRPTTLVHDLILSESARRPTAGRLPLAKPAWQWPALAAILLLTGLLDFYKLNQDGYGNTYYAAAVRSMLASWHNFFFVSFDPAGFVTVDKPPVGFWLQTASAWLFGFSGWSILAPQALAGVLSVAILFLLVRQAFGAGAGLLAALFLALTPINVATDRNNTIDGLLVLVLLLAGAAFSTAAFTGRLRWLLLGTFLIGVGFNVKMLEAFLPLPAFFGLYLVAAPLSRRVRITHLAVATTVLLAVSLSWATVVDLVPVDQRPYVGSSTNNTVLELIVGHNGLDRLLPGRSIFSGLSQRIERTSSTAASSAYAPASAQSQSANQLPAALRERFGDDFGPFENGQPGPLRFVSPQLAGQISWFLLPAILGAFVLVRQLGIKPPYNRRQQALILWGTWLATEVAFFSVASMFHPYYLVTLAPAIAALAGSGIVTLWRDYRRSGARWWLLPAGIAASALLQWRFLTVFPAWSALLSPIVLVVGIAAAVGLVVVRVRPARWPVARLATVVGTLALLIAPTVWAAIPIASASTLASRMPSAGPSQFDFGEFPVANGAQRANRGGQNRDDLAQTDPALIAYLEAHAGSDRYLVATPSAMFAAPLILATGKPVMAMGGFMGSDPILTTDQLANLVKSGDVRYFLLPVDRGPGPGVGSWLGGQSALSQWVIAHGTRVASSEWQSRPTGSASNLGLSYQLYDCGAPVRPGAT
jgi:4-amino-4-deoxy-L-arabinose transferase-like glycosyltransferase